MILSTLFTFSVGVFLRLKKGLSSKSQKQLQNWTFFLGLLVILQATAIGYLLYSDWKLEQQRVVDLYYRSDLALDAVENQAQMEMSEWFKSKAITDRVLAKDVLKFVKDRNPHLLFVNRSKLGYWSGAPGFILNEGPRVFHALYPAETLSYLKQLLSKGPQEKNRPILFISIKPFSRVWPFSRNSELASVLKQFAGAYYIEYPNSAKDLFTYFIKNPNTNQWVQTAVSENDFSFPVRKENWFVNKKEIAFPNITKLISPRECAKAIRNPEVKILFPFDSLYRPDLLVSYYLGLFFVDAPEIQKRILKIDWSNARLEDSIRDRAQTLQGKPFIIAGLSKHDWIYMGLDVALATYRSSPNGFNYLGACPWLAETAALHSQGTADKLATEKRFRQLGKPYRATVSFFLLLADYLDRFFDLNSYLNLLFLGLIASLPVLVLLPAVVRWEEFQRQLQRHTQMNPLDVWVNEPEYKTLLIQMGNFSPRWMPFLHVSRIIMGAVLYQVGSGLIPGTLPLSYLVGLASVIALRLAINKAAFSPKETQSLVTRRSLLTSVGGTVFFGVMAYQLTLGGALVLIWMMALQFSFELLLIFQLRKKPLVILPKDSPKKSEKSGGNPHSIEYYETSLIKGGKARNLILLSRHPWMGRAVNSKKPPALFTVAPGWISSFPFSSVQVPAQTTKRFVVRSSAALEDNSLSSGAGQFLTLLNVSAEEIPRAIDEVQLSFAGNGEVLIQEQQEMDLSGVLFTKSIDNPGSMQIDWAESSCHEVVSGKAKISKALIGRFSGKMVTPLADKIPSALLNRLFLVGKALEHFFGSPQDIEWGFSKKTQSLYVFQSRPITKYRFEDYIERDQIQLLQSLVVRTGSNLKALNSIKLRPSESDEVAKNPSPVLLDLLEKIYSLKGSLGIALKALGRPLPSHELFISGFGQLLQFQSQKFSLPALSFKKEVVNMSSEMQLKSLEEMWMNFAESASKSQTEDEILNSLDQGFKEFIEKVYPQVFIFGFKAKNSRPLGTEVKLKTKAEDLNRDLALLSPREIQSKWAHRGPQEYDPLAESFGTDPSLVESSQALFRLWDTHSLRSEMPDHPVVQREEAKDLALKYIHEFRILLIRLTKVSGVSKLQLRLLRLKDFQKLHSVISDLKNQRLIRKEETFALRFKIPRAVGFVDIEHLYFERRAPGREKSNLKSIQLSCLGAEKSLQGLVYSLRLEEPLLPPREVIPEGAVLVVPHLDPGLAAYFGKIQGIISVTGGSLSHLAIIGRENQIPIFAGEEAASLLHGSSGRAIVKVDASGVMTIEDPPDSSQAAA